MTGMRIATSHVSRASDYHTQRLATDLRRQWSSELWAVDEWKLAHPARHLLFLISGCSILNVYVDWMHTKHMGVDPCLYGSVLWLLVYRVLPGSPDDNLAEVWARIKGYYKEHDLHGHYCNLHIGMFTKRATPNSNYPKLRGRACEIKMLGLPLVSVWQHYHDPTSVVHGQIRMMLQASVRLETILSETSDCNVVPPGPYARLMTACNNLLVLYSAVHQHYAGLGMLMFNVIPKLHLLYHACEMSQYLHPKLTWCYIGPSVIQVLHGWLPHGFAVMCIRANLWARLAIINCITRRRLHAAQQKIGCELPPRIEEVAC